MIPYALARALLFQLDPESAHRFTFTCLDQLEHWHGGVLMQQRVPRVPCQVMGLHFPNPVGLAAGLDKDGAHIDALSRWGFGFIEVGTVTPRAQPGNPRPRLFRLPQAQALINRMGFNNGGVDAFVRNVQASRYYRAGGLLGLNIGKNADTPIERAVDDYLYCLERVYPYASYVTVNISSPNTQQLRELQGRDALNALLEALKNRQQQLAGQYAKTVPIVIKIAPDLDEEQIDSIAQSLLAHEINGVIATNTTLAREAVRGLPNANETGGLSGAPVRGASTQVIRQLQARLQNRVPIIGVGGILCGADALEKQHAGAQLVQLYSGLIYRGPGLVKECVQAWSSARASPTMNP